MIVTVKKGRHSSFTWPCLKSSLKCKIKFTNSCVYEHGDYDQYDWNKLIGLKKGYFKPRYNSIMIGWRWNIDKKVIEVCDYLHIKGSREYETKILEVAIGETLRVEIKPNEVLTFENDSDICVIDLDRGFKKGWLIRHWFGGQKKAPHDIRIEYL